MNLLTKLIKHGGRKTKTSLNSAYELVKKVDKKDLLFVALSLQTGYPLWTGDKKLIAGLKENGFHNTIETSEILRKIQDDI